MISDHLTNSINVVLKKLGFDKGIIKLEHPAIEAHGDYSANIALTLFPLLAKLPNPPKSPKLFAEVLAAALRQNKQLTGIVAKIDVAGPGFINFFLNTSALLDDMKRAAQKENYGNDSRLTGKKVMVEFTDPNPFKEFHIGHLYSNTVGESLSRLIESQGAIVKRANYQGDVGMHVAKSVWGMIKLADEMPKEDAPLAHKAKFLGQAYATGAAAFEEDEEAKSEITALNKKIYDRDPEVTDWYEKGRQWSLEYFETIYKRLGTNNGRGSFDYYYFESDAAKVGLEYVKEHLDKGVFRRSDGAVVFPGEEYGLHTRVFINSLGLPTYEAKELGLAPTKYKDFPYDESIIVTGNEINEYFRVLLLALQQVNPQLGSKTKHISHGMVRVPGGKMSSRKGNVLTGEWLLDETRKLIRKRMEETENPLPKEEMEPIAEIIAVGAVKYALLKSGVGRNVVFDIGSSISLEGNSGPYLQYTFARTHSVLSQADVKRFTLSDLRSSSPALRFTTYEPNTEELALLRWLYRFPEVVSEAASQYAPNLAATFLFELAQRFNTFYNHHRILNASGDQQSAFRLLLTSAVANILKSGLYLLGIQAPDKM